MAQATVDEIKSIPAEDKKENISSIGNSVEASIKKETNQPNVRHIPIFIEGRDEPIINKNISIHPENVQKPAPVVNESPQSIFNRVKGIPVRKPPANFDIPVTTNIGGTVRPESPARTIPIKVEHIQTKPKPSPTMNATNTGCSNNIPTQKLNENDIRSRSPSPMPPSKPMDSITKIQLIQKEILELMGKVEKFKGTSRQDKDYMYLDEMLTQNLLKLDTIDTEGKDNIKAARKEAINCINKCIAVLEAKVEQGERESTSANGDKIINSGATIEQSSNSNSGIKQEQNSVEKSETCTESNQTNV